MHHVTSQRALYYGQPTSRDCKMDASSKMLVSSMPSRKGYISEDVHRQAKKIDSPVVNDILVAARKGDTYRVLQALGKREGGAEASAVVDKVGTMCEGCELVSAASSSRHSQVFNTVATTLLDYTP